MREPTRNKNTLNSDPFDLARRSPKTAARHTSADQRTMSDESEETPPAKMPAYRQFAKHVPETEEQYCERYRAGVRELARIRRILKGDEFGHNPKVSSG